MNLYRCSSGGTRNIESFANMPTAASSYSFSANVGDVFLASLHGGASTRQANTRYDGATATNATLTKLANNVDTSAYEYGTFYKLVATGTQVTISHSNTFRLNLFKVS